MMEMGVSFTLYYTLLINLAYTRDYLQQSRKGSIANQFLSDCNEEMLSLYLELLACVAAVEVIYHSSASLCLHDSFCVAISVRRFSILIQIRKLHIWYKETFIRIYRTSRSNMN